MTTGKRSPHSDSSGSFYGSVDNDEVEMPSPPTFLSNQRQPSNGDSETYQLLQPTPTEIQLHALNGHNGVAHNTKSKGRYYHVRCRNVVLAVAAAFLATGLLFWLGQNKHVSPFLPGPFIPKKTTRDYRRFSVLDPVKDLGLYDYDRPDTSRPPHPLVKGLGKDVKNYPTNAWYQNLLMAIGEPESVHRTYTIPYVVDAAGPVPGLRVHPNHIAASSFVVQVHVIETYGLTLGASIDATLTNHHQKSASRKYKVKRTTPLGVTLEWDYFPMTSSITKGMPYATMRYDSIRQSEEGDDAVLPTVLSEIPLAKHPIIDGDKEMLCDSSKVKPVTVEKEVELVFENSDFSWLVFVSEPVMMQCVLDDTGGMRLQVVEWKEDTEVDRDLVIRIALLKLCSSGLNPVYCHQEKMHPTALLLGQGNYGAQLRRHANYFPGPNTAFDYEFDDDDNGATMFFDWDVQDMSNIALHPLPTNETSSYIGFALPHHFDIIVQSPPTDHDIYCVSSLIGPACLYEGSTWEFKEETSQVSFQAPRPPAPWAIQPIAESLEDDINYRLPDYYQRGAGDTYFSGKMLAKLGRILLISEEMHDVCEKLPFDDDHVRSEYKDACSRISLPDANQVHDALSALRSSVEVWINGTGETPFVFDSAWGGVVSCGCLFNSDDGTCDNTLPDCAAFDNPGLNFGNAYYNDMHFHYGYMIYAAAVVSHFDPSWGRMMFEDVLLLIRCIANPVEEDDFFPTFRHKDWFQGHSWASGIAMNYDNGKNQESSSEAIAAYEAVALYGSAMVSAWKQTGSEDNARIAQEVKRSGLLLAATELRSAKRYWHVQKDDKIKIFPSAYTPWAVGMLWQTMAQLQTWFGSAQFLAYGIQLLPLTPIAEFRDTLSWSSDMYHEFAKSCSSDPGCEENGWSVLQLALLATVGHPQMAAELADALPAEVFESAGGDGHSLSNSLWYFATRPSVEKPLSLTKSEKNATKEEEHDSSTAKQYQVTDCGKPKICTDYVLDTIAGLYSCRQRMDWLMQQMGKTEREACLQVAGVENPYECGRCNPEQDTENSEILPPSCPHCTLEQCQSDDLNRCPEYDSTFVCTDGNSRGGCQSFPWDVPSQQCHKCCELTKCPKVSPAVLRAKNEASCPLCSRAVCRGSINQCPATDAAQYLCLEGPSKGGCSSLPWAVDGRQCDKCCSLLPGC